MKNKTTKTKKGFVGVWIIIAIAVVVLIILYASLISNPKGITGDVISEKSNREVIKLGFIGPLTGDLSNLGQNAQKSVELAVKEINAGGGINGKQIKLLYEDSRCNAKDAINAANKLINFDQVPIIIGGLCSSETLAVAPLAEDSKTVLLSYCSSSPDVTNAGDFIFRDYPSDSFQGVYLADLAYNKLGIKKAAILYCLSDYCIGIRDTFKKRFEELGGTIAIEEGVEQTSRDLKTPLTKIENANVEGVLFFAYTESSVAGLKQAKELGLSVPILGADAWDDSTIWTTVGNAGEGVLFSTVAPGSKEFQEKLKTTYGIEATTCASQAYDAIGIITEIVNEVGIDREAIKNSLYEIQYQGASGTITFDDNGDLETANYVLKKVKNGKAKPVTI